jgi:hypothetical protein
MLSLHHETLRVDLLDPRVDVARLGPRFCWGGYVWQVHDAKLGPLLTGPEWPKPDPLPFNGQGLPESFRHRALDGRPLTWHGDQGVSLGAGELEVDAATKTVTVAKPCSWQIRPFANRVEFSTEHAAAGFHYRLQRDVELMGRELRSTSRLTNLASDRLTLEWFAHPFFALPDKMVRAEFPADTTIAENPGFLFEGRTLVQKRPFVRQDDGHMDRVKLPLNQPVVATVPTAKIGEVRFETSFVPAPCIIWGNDRTFSIEPYLPLDLAPAETREWSVRYFFGTG